MTGGSWFLLLFLSMSVLVLSGCGQKTDGETLSLKGWVVEVEAASLTDVRLLKVRDEQGRTWEFRANGPVGFTPSHLREHMLLGDQVTVYYRRLDGQLLAVKVTD